MTAINHRIRFMHNNFAALLSASVSYSSQLSAFPQSNAQNPFRSKVWKSSGHFLITASSNDAIYINDGSDKTITLTAGSYTTPALLATHIQTQLNASSSGWTVSHSTTTYKFTLTRSTPATLRFSQISAAAWDTLGYVGAIDINGTTFLADEQRNHTEEYAIYDMGYIAAMQFFAMIGPLGETLTFSETATVKIQANNLNSFSSPPFNLTLTRYGTGYFRFFDDQSDSNYRYWKVSIVDRTNPLGPEGLQIGHIYIGDYETFALRDVTHGYQKSIVDPTIVSVAESGALYFDTKTKYTIFENLNLPILTRANKDQLEEMFQAKGISTPFYISIDPRGYYTDDIDELTKYVVFSRQPVFTHTMRDMFSTSISLREAF